MELRPPHDPSYRPEPINLMIEPDGRQPRQKHTYRLLLFLLCLFVLVGGGAWLLFSRSKPAVTDNPLAYDPITLERKPPRGFLAKLTHFIFRRDTKLEGVKDDRLNILLLGMGGPGHDGPYLTDTMMIVSVKPSTQQIAMISIPRDLAVEIPGRGWYKINHANAFGELKSPGDGAALAADVVAKTFNLDIHYYARVDFQAFADLVDAVGGITVLVERPFTDSGYPAASDLYQTITFQAGEQTMNGRRALQFARSRHGNNGEGSDFARTRRQQKVLLALKEKIVSFHILTNPVRLNQIIKTLDTHLTTNLTFGDILNFIQLSRELHTDNIISLTLDISETGLLRQGTGNNGAYILEPKMGNFDDIRRAVQYIFETGATVPDDTPAQKTPVLTPAAIELHNGTWVPGLAARTRKKLSDKGFTITSVGNTNERPVPESGIYLVSERAVGDVLQALQTTLQIPVKQPPPPPLAQPIATSTDIIIILGEDFVDSG